MRWGNTEGPQTACAVLTGSLDQNETLLTEMEKHRSNSARTIHEEWRCGGYRVSLITDPSRGVTLTRWALYTEAEEIDDFNPQTFPWVILFPLYFFSLVTLQIILVSGQVVPQYYMYMFALRSKDSADYAYQKWSSICYTLVRASEVVMAFNFLLSCFSLSEACFLFYDICSTQSSVLTSWRTLWCYESLVLVASGHALHMKV